MSEVLNYKNGVLAETNRLSNINYFKFIKKNNVWLGSTGRSKQPLTPNSSLAKSAEFRLSLEANYGCHYNFQAERRGEIPYCFKLKYSRFSGEGKSGMLRNVTVTETIEYPK